MIADLRFALRRLAAAPGFSIVALLTLALGIGLNTSMFSLMNALLLRPLPYPDGANLVRVYVTTPQADDWALTAPVFRQVRESGAGFARLAAFGWWGASLTEPGRPAEMLVAVRATAEFLPTLGVQPELGRWFTPEEDRPGSDVVRDGWLGSGVVRACGCWVRCGDRAEQDAGVAQGALAGFLSERKNA